MGRRGSTSRRPNRLTPARGLAALALGAIAGGMAWRRAVARDKPRLIPALSGHRRVIDTRAGRICVYEAAQTEGRPLLLVHSINAAANAYEVRPLYEHYRRTRPVYALELPGFGFSQRADRLYTPRLMTDAIAAVTAQVRARHGGQAIDAVALSLSCAYLARAALEEPEAYASLGLISPTGFDARLSGDGPDGAHRGRPGVHRLVAGGPWAGPLFDALVSRPSMRFFLQKTWGSRQIDEGLLAYDWLSAHQPGARHAPFSFISGHLFPADVSRVYAALAGPVWVLHGQRGDFVDYSRIDTVARKPNWTIDQLPTGAFPHFEDRGAVTARYDAFLARLG